MNLSREACMFGILFVIMSHVISDSLFGKNYKMFNYKNVLQGIITENITRNPSECSCKPRSSAIIQPVTS